MTHRAKAGEFHLTGDVVLELDFVNILNNEVALTVTFKLDLALTLVWPVLDTLHLYLYIHIVTVQLQEQSIVWFYTDADTFIIQTN